MRQSDLKNELIKVYGEDLYQIILENSDGLKGLNNIKKIYSYNDLSEFREILISKSSFDLKDRIKEELGEIVIIKAIDQVTNYIRNLLEKIKEEKDQIKEKSQKLFEENEDSVIQTLLLKTKNKTELSQLKIKGNEDVFSQVQEISKVKWTKAYTQNFNDSIATNYSTFEYNILVDPVITTLKLL